MAKHPLVAGLIIGLFAILIIVILGLIAFPELIFIYRAVNRYLESRIL
jgi:hypothetical protein